MALLLSGKFADGIRLLEQEIDRYSKAGEGWFSTILRVQLAGFYIQVLTAKDQPPPGLIRKNLRTLIGIKLFGARRALALLLEAASSPHLSDRGVTRARIDFNLGELSAMKKRRAEAKNYCRRTIRPELPFEIGPMNGSVHQVADVDGTRQLRQEPPFLKQTANASDRPVADLPGQFRKRWCAKVQSA